MEGDGVAQRNEKRRRKYGNQTLTIDTPEVSFDLLLEGPRRELTTALALRGKVLPEERVIDVTAAIELESRLELDAVFGGVGLGIGLLGGVKAVDVGLMVLLVVKLHDLTGNVGLECLYTKCKRVRWRM